MDIWETVMGFMDAQIVMTAEELGVFNCLENGCNQVSSIATATGLPEDSAERMLIMLSAMEIVKKQPDESFANGPEASEQLVQGKPGYIGGIFHHLKHEVYPLWQYSKEALLEGTFQWRRAFPSMQEANTKMFNDPKALRKFMQGMHTITFEATSEFAGYAPELNEIEHLTDVGGASGAFLIALAKQFPNLQGSIFDLSPVHPIAEEYICKNGLENRLHFRAGNFWRDPIPAGADAYALGFILHDWSTEQGSMLLQKIANVSPPNGWLIIGEYLLNDEKTGPLWVARSHLNMLVTAKGRERNAAEYIHWVETFGFKWQKIYLTSKGKNFLIFRFQG